MKNIIRRLLYLEAVLVVLTAIIILATMGADNYNRLAAFATLTAAIVLGVVIMALAFIFSAKKSVNKKPAKNIAGIIVVVSPLILVPIFGIYYASIGTNREVLASLSRLILIAGIVLSAIVVFNFFRTKK